MSPQPISAPPSIEILPSPTEKSRATGNADIEFEAHQLSEWTLEELESEVVVSVSSSPSNESPSKNSIIVDSPEPSILDSSVIISTGHGGVPHQASAESSAHHYPK